MVVGQRPLASIDAAQLRTCKLLPSTGVAAPEANLFSFLKETQ